MTDVEFRYLGDSRQSADVSIRKAMTGSDHKAEALCMDGGFSNAFDLRRRLLLAVAMG